MKKYEVSVRVNAEVRIWVVRGSVGGSGESTSMLELE